MSHIIFAINLVPIQKSKVSLKFNKPAYIGMCILEISNLLMYELHYNYIKNKYDNKSKLVFKNTYSLMCEINTEDVYEDFTSNKVIFDFNIYLTKCYDDSKKLVIGKMKDETGGVAIEEFVGLKSRMY